MFKIFTPRSKLVEETSLSHFVHKAPAAEKRKIYNRVIQQASDEQRMLIEVVKGRRKQHEGASV